MHIEQTRRGLAINPRRGRYRRYSYRGLLPLFLTVVIFASTLILQESVRTYVARAWQNPRYWVMAVGTLLRNSAKSLENLLAAEPVKHESQLPTLHLFASKNTLTGMQESIRAGDEQLGHGDGGDRPYFSAVYLDEHQQFHGCKISLRGANAWHHEEWKPSLRVKLRKSDVRQGARYVELSRPKDVLALKNWLPQQFAQQMGLLSDRSDLVRLFLNRKYTGVYVRSMRPEDGLALAHGRMPGTFFKGDLLDGGDLWNSLDVWGIHGEENPANRDSFQRFLGLLRAERTPANLTALEQLLDPQVYAKWAALAIVTGSIHTDATHNHMYFVSSNRGIIEAVPWDCQSYGMQAQADVPVELALQPVMEVMLCDPRWVHRRNQVIYELLQSVAAPNRLCSSIDETVDRMLPDLRADVHLAALEGTLSGWRLVPYSVRDIEAQRREIRTWTQNRHRFLTEYLGKARVYVEPHPQQADWSRVTSFGTVAVACRNAGDGSSPRVLYPGLSQKPRAFLNRVHPMGTVVAYLTPAPLSYDVAGKPSELTFTNAITGAAVQPQQDLPTGLTPGRSLHPADLPAEPSGDVVLGPGDIELGENLRVGRAQRLIIRAGTRVRIRSGVGIFSQGVTVAAGTAEAPIEIVAADDGPWTTLAVFGDATKGSRFEYIRVAGGSSGTDGITHFKGMFNVYNCPEVTLRHCEFGANVDSDDAVNLAESKVLVEHCRWRDARSDALDLDLCDGVVRDSQWQGSGNDGLDLMGCHVRVERCRFVGSGDKGISVGEGSRATVANCQILSCMTGIESKDDSRVLVRDSILDGNKVALHSYQKHWLYGQGGHTALASCIVRNSEEADLSIEQRSQVLLCGTAIATIAQGPDRVTVVDELGAEWHVD